MLLKLVDRVEEWSLVHNSMMRERATVGKTKFRTSLRSGLSGRDMVIVWAQYQILKDMRASAWVMRGRKEDGRTTDSILSTFKRRPMLFPRARRVNSRVKMVMYLLACSI